MYVFGAWYYVWLEMRPMLCLYVLPAWYFIL